MLSLIYLLILLNCKHPGAICSWGKAELQRATLEGWLQFSSSCCPIWTLVLPSSGCTSCLLSGCGFSSCLARLPLRAHLLCCWYPVQETSPNRCSIIPLTAGEPSRVMQFPRVEEHTLNYRVQGCKGSKSGTVHTLGFGSEKSWRHG